MNIEIIAEIGQNHNGEISLAKELIHSAKENGADVAKFQIYDAKSLFTKENNDWYDYNCKTELSYDEVLELAELCKSIEIEFMASVFDKKRIEWLEEVNVKRYKVASRSVDDKELIEALIETKKPLLISLGKWNGSGFPIDNSSLDIRYLHCISKYPTKLSELGLSKVDFSRYSGFSDHTIGTHAAEIAMVMGAKIIEKHFTLDKKMYGPDHEGSMIPEELREIVEFKDDLLESM